MHTLIIIIYYFVLSLDINVMKFCFCFTLFVAVAFEVSSLLSVAAFAKDLSSNISFIIYLLLRLGYVLVILGSAAFCAAYCLICLRFLQINQNVD